jgi:hypothetical protein
MKMKWNIIYHIQIEMLDLFKKNSDSQYRNLRAWNLLLTCSSVNFITVSVEIDCSRFQSR